MIDNSELAKGMRVAIRETFMYHEFRRIHYSPASDLGEYTEIWCKNTWDIENQVILKWRETTAEIRIHRDLVTIEDAQKVVQVGFEDFFIQAEPNPLSGRLDTTLMRALVHEEPKKGRKFAIDISDGGWYTVFHVAYPV